MGESNLNNQCFNCRQQLEETALFCPHCGAPFPVVNPFLRRLLRALAGSVLALLSWCCGMMGLLVLRESVGRPYFLALSLALWLIAALSFVVYHHLSKE